MPVSTIFSSRSAHPLEGFAGRRSPIGLAILALAACAGCTTMAETQGPPRQENVFAVTQSNRLISFNAGQPARILGNRPLAGLQEGEKIAAIDYRVARGLLYAVGMLGMRGQLYVIDTAMATVQPVTVNPVGSGLQGLEASQADVGFDFNPTVDRIRLVDAQVNARIHPDTGRVVDTNPDVAGLQLDVRLGYAAGPWVL